MSHFDWKLLRRKKVIPADRRAITDKEGETWTNSEPEKSNDTLVDSVKVNVEEPKVDSTPDEHLSGRNHETRKSKSKRVKNYLRRCKGALTKGDDSHSCERKKSEQQQSSSSAWYVDDKKDPVSEVPPPITAAAAETDPRVKEASDSPEPTADLGDEIKAEDIFELCKLRSESKSSLLDEREDSSSNLADNVEINAERNDEKKSDETLGDENNEEAAALADGELNKCDSSDTLIAEQEEEEKSEDNSGPATPTIIPTTVVRGDAASLIRSYLGPIYGESVLDILTRQARDILVCAYHGNLENFVKSYLTPAVKLLNEVKSVASKKGNEYTVPKGWPLTLGKHGVVLRLGELEASSLRLGECYLCVRSPAAASSERKVKAADSAAEAANTTTAIISNSSSSTAALTSNKAVTDRSVAATAVDPSNTVEIALVWRAAASSMRAPGMLGWEDEYAEWRESSSSAVAPAKLLPSPPQSSHNTLVNASEQTSRWQAEHHRWSSSSAASTSSNSIGSRYRSRHESRSTERHNYSTDYAPRTSDVVLSHDGLKSKSSSSVDAWAEEARAARQRRSTSSSRCNDARDNGEIFSYSTNSFDKKNKLKRGTRVVSPAAMEKWKETSRCETRSRVLAPQDLATPGSLESAATSPEPGGSAANRFQDRQLNGAAIDHASSVCPPDEVSDHELPSYIGKLLVQVERKIERVSIDDLTFPCLACRNIDTDDPLLGCKCSGCECDNEAACECSNGTAKEEPRSSFEVAGIKHIDSDDEEEVRMGFGTKKKVDDVSAPKTIHDVPEKALNCGLTLPGYTDIDGRPVVAFDGGSTRREVVSSRDMASFFLYLARLPSANAEEDEFAILVKANSKDEVETLDRALNLLKDKVKIAHAYLLRNAPEGKASDFFPRCNLKIISVENDALDKHIPRRARDYNHELFIAYYKDYDTVMTEWQAAGRRLALEMLELKECTSLSGSLTPLNRLLTDPTFRRTATDAEEAVLALEERAAPLTNIMYIRNSLERARNLLEEVANAATRLESSFESRRATIRNLAVLRSIEDQAREVISWLCKKGLDILSKHEHRSATSLQTAKLHEGEFEKFYFTSMRHLDKGSDLAEAASASGLRELARSLKQHLRGFGARLEDRREYLEDTSRCCLLQDKAYDWAQEARLAGERRAQQFLAARPPLPAEHFAEMMALAEKLGNDILLDQCRLARSKCAEALEMTRTSSAPGSPQRRRSLAHSDSANSWDEALGKHASSRGFILKHIHLAQHLLTHDKVQRTSSAGGGASHANAHEHEREQAELHHHQQQQQHHHHHHHHRLLQTVSGTSWDDSDNSSGASCAGASENCGIGASGASSNSSNSSSSGGSGSSGSSSGASGGRLDNIAELRESSEQLLDCSPPRTPQTRSPQQQRRTLNKPPVNSHLHRAPSIAHGMKAKKTILLIMREMIQTERDYVKSLEYIIENYIPELLREDIPQSLRGQRNVIFGNVEKIYEFHSQYFLHELESCEHSPMMVGQCFLRHEKKFYLYALYNKNKPNSDSLMAEYGTAFFKAKQLELGDKMDLASYLLKPVQRMGKYALLLQQLVKAGMDLSEQLSAGKSSTNSGDDGKDDKDDIDNVRPMVEGEADLRSAEQMVRFQLRHGNDLLAMDSLRDCDVNVKEQGRLLRQNEFLVWQGKGKKCLRQVFLFEDLILFSKARRFPDRKNLDIYIYKHSIKTTDIGLTAVIADSPTKFEIWFRKRKPGDTYTLQCASEDIKKAWTEELSNLLWKQALRNREVRLAEMSSMGIGNKPCLDIRPSADQISDRSISVAQLSKTAPRFRNSIAVSSSDDSSRCSRRPHSVISVSSSSSSGGSSGPPNTLNLGLDTSPRLHHRSTTLNSQCSVESGIIADISIISDDGGDGGTERSHWNSTLESPTSHLPPTGHSTPAQLQSPTTSSSLASPTSSEAYDVSVNL